MRLSFVALGVALSSSIGCRATAPEPRVQSASVFRLDRTATPLNVIVISLDAVRYDRTGLGSSPTPWTPHLDAFAKESVVFHHAVSAAPWTVPSHLAMWTARWPTHHGMVNKLKPDPRTGQAVDASLDPSIETYTDRLRAEGYTAAAFTGGAGVSARFGYGRGFEVYVDDRRFAGMEYSLPLALEWLQKRVSSGRSDPFFLFFHGYDAHGQHPLEGLQRSVVSPWYRGTLDGSIEENARLRERGLSAIEKAGDEASLRGVITQDDGRFLRDVYDRKIEQADKRLGQFLDALRTSGVLDKSIVAVVSDHGDEFMEHGHIDHGHTLFEEQLHVVMMIRFPHGAGHRDVRVPVRTIDLFPTLFDALGLRGPANVDGTSLLPVMTDTPATVPRPVFAESDYRLFVHHRMVRLGDYKLVLDMGDNQVSLFDLAHDPQEQRDLATQETQRRDEMMLLLRNWLAEQHTAPDAFLGVRESHITIF